MYLNIFTRQKATSRSSNVLSVDSSTPEQCLEEKQETCFFVVAVKLEMHKNTSAALVECQITSDETFERLNKQAVSLLFLPLLRIFL